MSAGRWREGPHTPFRGEEASTVHRVLDALGREPDRGALADVIVRQAQSLEDFGALLARYPSPLEEQTLGGRRRSLDTLVESLCSIDHAAFALRAPTQAIVGRALNTARINFFRLLWHVCSELADRGVAALLREAAAHQLRPGVYSQLVEELLSDLVTDAALPEALRASAVRHLAHLWGHRLTWRANEFFPVLEATWEARVRCRVVGGTLVGASEIFQLMTRGGDLRFIELLTSHEHGQEEAQAFREFLFGRSSEDLERLAERMKREGLTSIEIDSQLTDSRHDAGSLFYEFFQVRSLQATARRLAAVPGPKRTAEGYVLLAWLRDAAGAGELRR